MIRASSFRSKSMPWPLHALPVVRIAGRFPLDDFGFSYGYRSTTHALHIYDYAGAIQIGAKRFAIRAGDVTLTPAGVVSRYDVADPGHHWCVHFEAAPPDGQSARLPLHCSPGPAREFAIERLTRIARLHAQSEARGAMKKLARAAASAALQELLLSLALYSSRPERAPRRRRSDDAIEKLISLLDTRFTEPLSVPQLARQVGLAQNYLARQFRSRFGMTIPRYLLSRRIGHARHLLLNTDMPVGRIAARVGYPDAQHFNKQFRRLTGSSPTGLRDQRELKIRAP